MSTEPDLTALLRHRDFVRALAVRLVKDPTCADDLAQEAWLSALEHPPKTAASLRAWLGVLLRNLAHNFRRSERRLEARHEQLSARDPTASAVEIAERMEAAQLVVRAVMQLAEPYKSAILLRYYEHLSAREIAHKLEAPLETVRARLKRGLDRLREQLAERDHRWAVTLTALASQGSGAILMSTTVKASLVVGAVLLVTGTSWLAMQNRGSREPPQRVELDATSRATPTASDEQPSRETVTAPASAPVASGTPTATREPLVEDPLRKQVHTSNMHELAPWDESAELRMAVDAFLAGSLQPDAILAYLAGTLDSAWVIPNPGELQLGIKSDDPQRFERGHNWWLAYRTSLGTLARALLMISFDPKTQESEGKVDSLVLMLPISAERWQREPSRGSHPDAFFTLSLHRPIPAILEYHPREVLGGRLDVSFHPFLEGGGDLSPLLDPLYRSGALGNPITMEMDTDRGKCFLIPWREEQGHMHASSVDRSRVQSMISAQGVFAAQTICERLGRMIHVELYGR